jgi:hypothetical protein
MEEDAAGSGQILGDDGVQETSRDAALDDDPAEPRARRRVVVVVKRVAVAGELRDELDVAYRDAPRPRRLVTDLQRSSRESRRSLSTRPPV